MKITLRIDGEDKTFTNDFVKARVFRNALKLNEQMRDEEGNISVDMFDNMIEFVTTVFDKQFTVDEVWDGIRASKLQSEIMRIFSEVLNYGGLEIDMGED